MFIHAFTCSGIGVTNKNCTQSRQQPPYLTSHSFSLIHIHIIIIITVTTITTPREINNTKNHTYAKHQPLSITFHSPSLFHIHIIIITSVTTMTGPPTQILITIMYQIHYHIIHYHHPVTYPIYDGYAGGYYTLSFRKHHSLPHHLSLHNTNDRSQLTYYINTRRKFGTKINTQDTRQCSGK